MPCALFGSAGGKAGKQMEYELLGKIQREELNKLSYGDCAKLCAEIRTELVERVSENGGHLASNLGVVELTLALHRVFNFPEDRLIFDVGHQSYVHKMLSDRLSRMNELRKPGGLSGFQRRDESPFDAFGGGHASTSLSAALGFAQADRLNGSKNFTVCVVGDGAFTGGMIHEGLNNCRGDLRLIIILNENEMSISKNTGYFAASLLKLRNSSGYFRFKRKVKRVFSKTLLGQKIYRFSARQKQRIKRAIFADNYFEQLGIDYLGPIDGHDEKKLELLLNEAKRNACCTLIHVKTVKGKGYEPAEKDPDVFHGLQPRGKTPVPTFSEHMGKALTERAKKDEKICAITAAMASGTGLTAFEKELPDRFFDVGIAEEHALTFSAALSAAGMKPVFAVYSTFLQRCYDQLIHDAALQRLPLTLLIDRAGISTHDGPTHHGLFDVAMALSLTGAEIFAPLDFKAADVFLDNALANEKISFIRYRSGGENEDLDALPYIDEKVFLRGSVPPSPDAYLLTYGQSVREALRAAKIAKENGKNLAVLALESIVPEKDLTASLLTLIAADKPALFVEEGVRNGGAAERWQDVFEKFGRRLKVLAIKDPFLLPQRGESPYAAYGISAEDQFKKLFG